MLVHRISPLISTSMCGYPREIDQNTALEERGLERMKCLFQDHKTFESGTQRLTLRPSHFPQTPLIIDCFFVFNLQKEPQKVDLFQDTENLKDAQEYGKTLNLI